MKKTFKVKEVCQNCKGTGVFSGMAEGKGAGVICLTCKGTGCHNFIHTYEKFIQRKKAENIKRVYEANVGIGIGEGNGFKFEDFGGMPFEDWLAGKPFPKGSEMRKFTCPAWWYQSVNYKLKPNWKECRLGGSFVGCSHFHEKEKCWTRFDEENK